QRELTLLFPSLEGYYRTTGEVVQADLKKVGVTIRLQQTEWVTYRSMLRNGEFDLAYRIWWADYPDGDNFLYPLFHSSQIGTSNFSRFNDPEMDQRIEASQRELDPQRREVMLTLLDDAIYSKAPAVFLWHRVNITVCQPWLHHYSVPLVFNGIRYDQETIAPPAHTQGESP
ncbi:MAG: ABC transporter substrate-binding protein, partial [bacterium]|nr:ABC transporter substrate-binding protein [bacterium]